MSSSPSLLRPLLAVAFAVLLAAVAITWSLSGSHDDARVIKSTGLKLTTHQAHGRQLFAQRCATCHTLTATGAVGKVGPNLDILGPYGLDASFVKTTIDDGVVRGNGTMPAGVYSGQDADDVASFLSAVTRDEAAATPDRPRG